MRCYICDSALTPEATHYEYDHEKWAPCPSCLMAVAEIFDDHLEEGEITFLLDMEDYEEIQEVEEEIEEDST